MAENKPFKDLIDEAVARGLAARLVAVVPEFDQAGFTAQACAGLQDLELKARVAHIALALRDFLSPDVPRAITQLLATLGPPLQDCEEVTQGIAYWPMLHFVEVWGPQCPQVSLPALKRMTRRFSAEFALRPFLEQDQQRTLAELERWIADPDPHVRRTVSECTRPRLPWGRRLRRLQGDPRPALPLLEALHRDEEEYVRRSVANHLNDISKDHPELAVQVARRWWQEGDQPTRRLVRHALRGLIKAGHPGALDVLGFGPPEGVQASLTVQPDPVSIGERVTFARIRSAGGLRLASGPVWGDGYGVISATG